MKDQDRWSSLLPVWGPYSKKYMGVSRIMTSGLMSGARFDFVVHPMLANSGQSAPNVTFPSAWHIWGAAADLSYAAYRVELEWKDQVFADVSFSRVGTGMVLVRTAYVNRTDLAQLAVLNYYAALEYPREAYLGVTCEGPMSVRPFADGRVTHATPRPWEHLTPDGHRRGEFFDARFLDGRGIGERTNAGSLAHVERRAFGAEAGDRIELELDSPCERPGLHIRYRTVGEGEAAFVLTARGGGREHEETLFFPPCDELTLLSTQLPLPAGKTGLVLTSLGQGGIELDFAAFTEDGYVPECTMHAPPRHPEETDMRPEGPGRSLLWRYPGCATGIGFSTLSENTRLREIPSGCLEDAYVSRLSQGDPSFDRVTASFTSAFREKHSDEGYYRNVLVHTIRIPPGGSHTEYALIGDGEMPALTEAQAEAWYLRAREKNVSLSLNRDGRPYAFSADMLMHTLLTNIVYPIRRHGTWICHPTPGKRWDSLYTWDSGFIGLGFLEAAPALAEYVLDLYLSEEDNDDFAFLHHGSPVPVQAFLFLELLQRAQDKSRLMAHYPMLKRYFCFLAGLAEDSTTAPFRSGLTTTFDYFYNCSGMDDLPPQAEMHARGMEKVCAPVISASVLVRMAKILRMAAKEAGYSGDIGLYDGQIRLHSEALERYAWDEESGYYGYVVHDEQGEPRGILRTPSGENLDKGMDGIYPLLAGIPSAQREARLLGHLFSDREMFSPVGISAVDMSASYYRPNGYWNGNVWFSHQWFIWKTMLDLGEPEKAMRIATTALEAWKREVDHSYYTFEMLNIATGRGGWFHQFGGLSSPIAVWACAYYTPGMVTAGFDAWVVRKNYDPASDRLHLEMHFHSGRDRTVLVTLRSAEGREEQAAGCLPGKLRVCRQTGGTLAVTVPGDIRELVLDL